MSIFSPMTAKREITGFSLDDELNYDTSQSRTAVVVFVVYCHVPPVRITMARLTLGGLRH